MSVDMNESATARLDRLLTMVPWLLRHQGVEIDVAAREFGVSPEQVEADLALLFLCGTPGGYHDDLIDAQWEDGRVYVSNADTIARPLRLGVDEALSLMVGLRALAAVPGLGERDAVDRALAKLEAATGEVSGVTGAGQISVDMAVEADDDGLGDGGRHLTALRGALAAHRRVHLSYVVPSRDETTERDVDPMRLVSVDGPWYLEAWCHRAQDVRLFRLDRISALEVLDADGTPPADARPRDLDNGIFRPDELSLRVELDLAPQARWVRDYYPCESATELDGGGLRVTIATSDTAWLRRLLLRLGGAAHVVSPAELRETVRQAAQEALARYQ
ncbi:helix-turn-helix transcriptional regulator [Arsenicicoccus sp. oral taxon 190]|uniref:helix-turn-helix transcriptional regulator n=1 Tax=Arsenicicoccus sp. oral taxon 190 TaxID=1658671 RepID=UPI00067A34A3|nr:WYL domain-containing protein [Arsenicicoccus sp. oral taxon 190]AKT51907.1 proteasome protein [Arsenicicoccus sp. oral taxon 190]